MVSRRDFLKAGGTILAGGPASTGHVAAQETGDYIFSFHDDEEIGPRMLSRITRRPGLKPSDLYSICFEDFLSPNQSHKPTTNPMRGPGNS